MTKNYATWFIILLLGICMVDSLLVYTQLTPKYNMSSIQHLLKRVLILIFDVDGLSGVREREYTMQDNVSLLTNIELQGGATSFMQRLLKWDRRGNMVLY